MMVGGQISGSSTSTGSFLEEIDGITVELITGDGDNHLQQNLVELAFGPTDSNKMLKWFKFTF